MKHLSLHRWLVRSACLTLLLAGCAQNLVANTVRSGQQARQQTAAKLENPQAISVVLCGTGGPMPSPRAQSCTAVFAGGKFFLFDAGDGAARSLEALNLPITHLHAILLTHYHSDHFADLGEVIDRSWINGRRENLAIYGPQGLGKILDGILAAYQLEYGYRTAHHGEQVMPSQYAGAAAVEFQAPTGEESVIVYDQDGVVIKAFRENHDPVVPALGYRIEYSGKVVVISGDTSLTQTLQAQSQGADLLVCEVMNKDLIQQVESANRSGGNDSLGAILNDIRGYHLDVSEVGQLAQQAQVKRLALTHLTPPVGQGLQMNQFFKQPVQKIYTGELIVGDDGATIVIPLQ